MEARADITVAAVDDHEVVLLGLQHALADDVSGIHIAAIEPTVKRLLARPGPVASVVLLDLSLPDEPDVPANVAQLRAAGARVVIFTSESRPGLVRAAVDAGALGVALKSDPVSTVIEAIRCAHDDEFFVSSPGAYAMVTDPRAAIRLSKREKEVLALVARGLPHKLIARSLEISENTLPSYLKRIAERYRAAGLAQATPGELAVCAVRDGHIELGDPLL